MDWIKAYAHGTQFFNDVKKFFKDDDSEERRIKTLKHHKVMLENGGWNTYKSFNELSVEEFADVLGLDFAVDYIGTSRITKNMPVPLIFCKEDDVDDLSFEDYTDLIGYADKIGDTEWRNELLERECGL